MKSKETLVVGSLAFDVMFSIPQDFRQSIPLQNGQIQEFNATYIANRKNEYPGGTAGNIAAWLGYKQHPVSVFSAWGVDLKDKGYEASLKAMGHELKGDVGNFTAHCYNVSDPIHQQLVIWQPNHYEQNENQSLSDYYSDEEIKNFKFAIFAAGTPASIQKHMAEFRAINTEATVLFDPGQVSPFFDPVGFKACVALSDIVIGNQVEAEHFERYMQGFWPPNLTQIITLGGKGVSFRETGKNWESKSAIRVDEILDTTGAGDAFRAGILLGLSQEQSLPEALALALELGAKSVTLPNPQPSL